MGAKGEALAKQFEAKAQEATAVLEKLSEVDWKKVTEAEKWSVGVTAHHVAGSHEGIAGIIKTVAAGQSMPNFTMDMLHQANAQHAKEHANCSRGRFTFAIPVRSSRITTSSMYLRVQKPCSRTPSHVSPATRSIAGPTAAIVTGIGGWWVETGVKFGVISVNV